MTVSLQTGPLSIGRSKTAPNRHSNRRCHSKQSKSDRLRQWSASGRSNMNELARHRPKLVLPLLPPSPPPLQTGVERGHSRPPVSINHDSESRSQRHRGSQKVRPIATSGMRTSITTKSKHHPKMISPKESKSTNGGRQQKHLKLAADASATLAQKSVSALVMVAVALMVASSFFSVNLIGPCNCDTLSGHNPFSGDASGGRASRSQPSATTTRVERRQSAATATTAAAAAATTAAHQVASLKLASIESQHFGAGHSRPSPADSTFKLAAPNKPLQSSKLHDDFLRDILASHERRPGTSNKLQQAPASLQTAGSGGKADLSLRQIMMMHEHAAASTAAAQPASSTSRIGTKNRSNLRRPQAKILSALPGDLLAATSSRLISLLPSSLIGKKATNATDQAAGLASEPTIRILPFSQRASAKNLLLGSITGIGQQLVAQPNSPEQKKHSARGHLKSAAVSKMGQLSQPRTGVIAGTQQRPPIAAPPHDSGPSPTSSTSSKEADVDKTKAKLGEVKKSTIIDGATDLAQAYLKDSFRDLLTLTQLPIFSGGPISTAPSELEPGGKKWLANKQAAEQIRGNKTNAIEDLLRYIYILGNVGVRRKRDPLRVLSSNSRPLNALSTSGQRLPAKRPLFSLFDVANIPAINAIIKLRPSTKLTGSKLSSLLGPTGDQIKSRGVMWEMATDPTLAVTMMHLLERASVALPLGFLLMPFVRMTRHPFAGISLDRILPARASHRSVDLEELAKRLDMVDKILSRSMRPTHRDAPSFMG